MTGVLSERRAVRHDLHRCGADAVGHDVGDAQWALDDRRKLVADFDVLPVADLAAEWPLGERLRFDRRELVLGPRVREHRLAVLAALAGGGAFGADEPRLGLGDQLAALVPVPGLLVFHDEASGETCSASPRSR